MCPSGHNCPEIKSLSKPVDFESYAPAVENIKSSI
jgi:hypothetical protein